MERDAERPTRRAVLYVEDHPVNVMLMSAIFERCPRLRLVVARDGQEARHYARGLNPALLLLDMRLPDCHGSQLLPILRQIPGCESAPAVAVTAESEFSIAGTDFSELWPKPLHLDHVLQRLEALAQDGTCVGARLPASALGSMPLRSARAR